ncbi:hypothetical protein [Stenotrophomonas sp. Ste96]|uniref:hypothetical protein n=1 Tax=Stenotrophomonas sp. Ste96 TaxID=2926029 RepID=UPI0021C9FEC9|nr:hypothetical protein [Stenotrophomonas sp. Ste96]
MTSTPANERASTFRGPVPTPSIDKAIAKVGLDEPIPIFGRTMTSGIYNVAPMESPRYQLARAREKFQDIQAALAKYALTTPFAVVTEESPSTGMQKTVLRRVKNTPIFVAAAVNDAFEPLRKALDQVGYAVAKAANMRGKNCAFPFGDTEKEVRGRSTGVSRELPEEIFELMVSFRPYKDGDQQLWALNEIANTSKHRITKTFPGSLSGASLKDVSMSGTGSIMGPWNEGNGEMMIAEVTKDTSLVIGEITFSVHLVFGDIPVVCGQPIEPTFSYVESVVKNILDAVEAKAVEMGLFPQ